MKKLYIIIILVFIIWIVWPLLQPGYIPTHDGEFSIIRIWQYSKMMVNGHIFPRWAPDLNSGYGVPLFTFYYPLPYLIGSLFYFLGSTLVDSFKLTLALSYTGAGILCYLWLRKISTDFQALVGTLLMLQVPYWFVNMYVRGSIGEVMAVCALFGALVAVEYNKPRVLALWIAALILSHNISAMVFAPLLGVTIYLRNKKLLSAVLWGISLASFFWIPALFEQRFVLGLSNFDYRDHFPQLAQLIIPSWGTGFSRPGWPPDEMSQQMGIGVITLLIMNPRVLLLILPIIYVMTEQSSIFWGEFAPIRFIQYPWRLLMLFIPLTGYLGAKSIANKKFLAWGVILVSFVFSFLYNRPVIYLPRNDEYYLTKREFTDGTTTVGNSFSTAWLTWQKDRPNQIFEAVSDSEILANISYYPGWIAIVDGKQVRVTDHQGKILIRVPKEFTSYVLQFRETPMRLFSNTLSVVSLFWLVCSGILDLIYAYSNRRIILAKRS